MSPLDTGVGDAPDKPAATEPTGSSAHGKPAAADPTGSSTHDRPRLHLSAAELVGVFASATIGIGYLLPPLMGGDLSAQLARADVATAFPLTPVDLR
jgi:hypothetical protein